MNDILDRMSVLSVGNGQTNSVYLSRLFYQNCGKTSKYIFTLLFIFKNLLLIMYIYVYKYIFLFLLIYI